MNPMQTPAVPDLPGPPLAAQAQLMGERRERSPRRARPPLLRVRMYRVGMGDCFLLTFRPGTDDAQHVLVDIGSIGQGRGASLDEVIDDIRQVTGGHLAAAVATHEHADHISGFPKLGRAGVQAGEVWMAWTEDPSDPLARQIAKYHGDLLCLTADAGAALTARGAAGILGDVADGVREVLSWNGVRDGEQLGADLKDGLKARVQEMMSAAARLSSRPPLFCSPGTVLQRDWAPGVRFYVLGPPRDAAAIQQLGQHGSRDLYELSLAAGVDPPRAEAALEARQSWEPFDAESMVPLDRALGLGDIPRRYAAEPWRKVDDAFLGASAELALQLDSATNNTSLVLAIEVGDDVVLLAADAQLGSWLSWPKQRFDIRDGGERRRVTGAELLRRVTLYKVGHHCSFNGTAKPGLEEMGEHGLTALVSLDEQVAHAKRWPMPARELEARLQALTHGRVVRSDHATAAALPPSVHAAELYDEVTIEAPAGAAEEARAEAGVVETRH